MDHVVFEVEEFDVFFFEVGVDVTIAGAFFGFVVDVEEDGFGFCFVDETLELFKCMADADGEFRVVFRE